MAYERASFGPLEETGYGIGFHWTTATCPRKGEPLPFEEAVDAFDVDAFVAQAVGVGAGHVLFTSTHGKHHFCCPHPEVDKILPGRTCRRDLLMEIADGLAAHDIRFIVYYHHGLGKTMGTEWREAVGGRPADPAVFYDNWRRIVGYLGEHYGPKITAFWFDSARELAAVGDAPWQSLTAAAKAGHPDRLVCYNTGIENVSAVTECQDYWAGEVCRLNYVPRTDQTPAGLPWYAFLSWHGDSRKPMCGHWVMNEENRTLDWPPPAVESAARFLRGFRERGGTVTFNLLCYQDGSALETDLEVVRGVKDLC